MATTQNTYTGNGSTTNYTFSFEYIAQSDVKVTLDTVATTAYTFANATTLSFTTAPANGVAIRIYRDTNIDNLQSTFFPGSAIKAEDLNNNFTQSHFAVQETDNEVITANTTASSAVTTANSAVTTANSAVTTANSADTKSDAAVATANTASTTASSAVTTANAATTTANSASSAAASAVSTANAADTKADTAISTANTASSNASTAVSTANSANTAAANAVTTADAATVTANNATTTANSAVTTANTANTNATAAQSAATTAQASATAAQTSATAAQTSATAAQAQATLAADVRNAFTITDSNSDGTFDFVVGDIPIKGNNGVKLPFESVTYAEEGAIRYNNSLDKIELYNGAGQWVTAAGGAAVSSSPPSLPSAGDVWYDHDNGRAYVYYNDGDSNQWVEMNPSWNGYVADNSISSAKIIDGAIVNADINASAAIAGTKISPDFGSQNVLTTGNVGIGTTSPGQLLHLNSSASTAIQISDGTNNQFISSIKTAGNFANGSTVGDILIRGQSGFAVSSNNGSSVALRIDSSGNVKIGNGADRTSLLTAASSNLQVDGGIVFEPGSGNDAEIYNYRGTSMKFGTSGVERMRIDNDGRLLLGLSSTIGSNALLQVQGSGNRKVQFHQPDTGQCLAQFTNSVTGNGVTDGFLVGLDSTEDGMIWQLENNNLTFGTADTERMRIDSSGNVGIGTSSPANTFVVFGPSSTGAGSNNNVAEFAGPSRTNGFQVFVSDTNNNCGVQAKSADAFLVNPNGGNVGIGTTSVSSNLHIRPASNDDSAFTNGVRVERTNTAGQYVLLNYTGGAATITAVETTASNPVTRFLRSTNGSTITESLRIDGSGRLLVGTSTDTTARLVVKGNAGSGNDGINVISGSTTAGSKAAIFFSPSTTGSFSTGSAIKTERLSPDGSDLQFYTCTALGSSPTERMRITSDGTLQQGDPSTNGGWSAFVSDNGSAHQRGRFIIRAKSTTGGANEILQIFLGTTAKLLIRADGNLYNAAGGIGVLSDLKLKENIVSANSQWGDIKAIQIRNFNFKEETGHDTHTQIGVVAQEVETVSPGLVSDQPDKDKDGNDLGTITKVVNTSVLYMKAVKALQEAMERIETLETKVNALEGA